MKTKGKEILKENVSAILKCEDDFLLMKQSVDNLYNLFYSITGISAYEFKNEDIFLPFGKAISPAGAAHCLMEMKRTAVFLRGIHQAILDKQKTANKPINILYAGCGPYATLIIPLLTLYNPTDIQIALLDINPISLNAARKIVTSLDMDAYINAFFISDATSIKTDVSYDIIISETMQACLKREPQVAVMKNLIPQLNKNGLFIPEKISVDAVLTCPADENENLLYKEESFKPERKLLGNIFSIHKENLDIEKQNIKITIPQDFGRCHRLQLFTTVTVYKDFILKANDSSITMPKTCCYLNQKNISELEFSYILNEDPKIHIQEFENVE